MNLSTIDADSGISNSQPSTLEEVIKVLNNEPRAERSDANDQNRKCNDFNAPTPDELDGAMETLRKLSLSTRF